MECTCNESDDIVKSLLMRNDFDIEEDEECFEEEDDFVILADDNFADFLFGEEDNITSCNKVEKNLVYSEIDQNLLGCSSSSSTKATEPKKGLKMPTIEDKNEEQLPNRPGRRLWTLRRQSTEDMFLSSDKSSSENKNSEIHNSDKELPTFVSKAKNMHCKRNFSVIEEVST